MDGHLLKGAILEYKKHREELKSGDDNAWDREDSGLDRWEAKYGDRRLALLDDAAR